MGALPPHPPLSPARRQGLGANGHPHPCRERMALQGRQGAESSPQAAVGRTNPLTASPRRSQPNAPPHCRLMFPTPKTTLLQARRDGVPLGSREGRFVARTG